MYRTLSIAAFILLGASGLSAFASANTSVLVHRDDEAGFILQYPGNWSSVPATHQRTRLKIVSERGAGSEDCVVNVQIDETLRGVPLSESIRRMPDARTFQRALRSAIPDATVVESGKTYLSNQEAIFFVSVFTFRSAGLEIPVKMITIQTIRDRRVYTVGCRAREAEFDSLMPVFQIIFGGLLIKN